MVAARPEPVTQGANWPRFFYITGCDGTGKTTQARLLLEQLRLQGVKARQVWLRFPFFFSLPLLAYARLRGLSWYENKFGVRNGYWDFRYSKFLRILLPWTLLIDAIIGGILNIFIPIWMNTTVVCERFVLDMIVDLEIALNSFNIHNRIPGKLYFDLLPLNRQIIILDLDVESLRNRRKDLLNDRNLEIRLNIFRNLAEQYSIPVLSSKLSIEELNNEIITKWSVS